MLRAVTGYNPNAASTTASVILGGDIALATQNVFFDGPSINIGTTGTWFVSGSVTLMDAAASTFDVKLWDGTTIVASTVARYTAGGVEASLDGIFTNPAGNVRLSVKCVTDNTATIKANLSGSGADSALYAFLLK